MEGTEPPVPAPSSGGSVSDYPVTFGVEYPDRGLNRVSTAFRIFAAIPIFILAATLTGGYTHWGENSFGAGTVGGVLGGTWLQQRVQSRTVSLLFAGLLVATAVALVLR